MKKNVHQFDMDTGLLLNTYEDLNTASTSVNAKSKSISNACLGYNKSCSGFYWSYNESYDVSSAIDQRKKQVIQNSMNGDFVCTFSSASEASRLTGISKSCISRCCRGERSDSGGFKWNYV